jgi:hypothetical protein
LSAKTSITGIGGPVVGRAHHLAHLVEELREALRLGPLLREFSSGHLHHVFGHCGADLAHAFLRFRVPTALGVRAGDDDEPADLFWVLDSGAQADSGAER